MILNIAERSGSPSKRHSLSRLARAGLLTGVTDGIFSSVLSVVFYHSTVARLFQGVASVLLGAEAFKGGAPTAMLGILMHFGVAFGWSIAFSLVIMRAAWIRKVLVSPFGVAKISALYGPFIWMTMSLVVIPILTQHSPAITPRWWIQLFGHIPFVGVPIVASIKKS